MLDVNRLLGFVFNVSSVHKLMELKESLTSLTGALEANDLAIVGEQCCKGPGEITGALMNLPLLKDQFVSTLKVAFHAIGTADLLVKKDVFVVSEKYDHEAKRTIFKLLKANQVKYYECDLHLFCLDGTDETVTIEGIEFQIKACDLETLKARINERIQI